MRKNCGRRPGLVSRESKHCIDENSSLLMSKHHYDQLLACWFGPELHEGLELRMHINGELVTCRRSG